PVIRIIGYQDFAIQYEVRYFFTGYEEFRRIEGEIHRLIWYPFKRHGIEIPFPVRNVFLHQVEAPESHKEAPATRLEGAVREMGLFRPLRGGGRGWGAGG